MWLATVSDDDDELELGPSDGSSAAEEDTVPSQFDSRRNGQPDGQQPAEAKEGEAQLPLVSTVEQQQDAFSEE